MTEQGTPMRMLRTCAIAALLVAPMGPAGFAQGQEGATGEAAPGAPQPAEEAGRDRQGADAPRQEEEGRQQPEAEAAGEPDGQGGGPAPDVLVATVGEREFRTSDVMAVIAALPEELRAQEPETLVPIALDQLILRELILQEARAEDLADDPEVRQLVEGGVPEDDAIVQVWLRRDMDGRVTEQQVEQTYDEVAAGLDEGAEVPPLETVRPQIEQQLRQEAMSEIRASLYEDADITIYGPQGEPVGDGADSDTAPSRPPEDGD